jgi:putative tributyrin esterase
MATIATMQLPSAALERQVTYTVILPEKGTPPFPVLYQLHGRTDDHRAWIESSNLVRYVAALPLIVVLPDGGTSFYADIHPLARYQRFMIDELPEHLQRTFHVRPGKAAIGGLSMGGYGAIRLGLLHPDRFASIFAHSSRLPSRAELPQLDFCSALDEKAIDELDVDALAARIDPRTMPALAFDCGTEDHRLGDSRRFHHVLEKQGIPHHYAEHPGAHTWEYWDSHVKEALAFHARALALST